MRSTHRSDKTPTECVVFSGNFHSRVEYRATRRRRRSVRFHEGGELGYALAHAYGAAFDKSDVIIACVVGDGEAETGPLAASWHCNTFLNPASDGAVLPVLHLNGYKIANSTILGRMPDDKLISLFRGYGYEPILVAGSEPNAMHQRMAAVLDEVIENIHSIRQKARKSGGNGDEVQPPRWPLIILRSPKG